MCLPRQAGLLRVDHGDTLATVERISIDIDGLSRCSRRSGGRLPQLTAACASFAILLR